MQSYVTTLSNTTFIRRGLMYRERKVKLDFLPEELLHYINLFLDSISSNSLIVNKDFKQILSRSIPQRIDELKKENRLYKKFIHKANAEMEDKSCIPNIFRRCSRWEKFGFLMILGFCASPTLALVDGIQNQQMANSKYGEMKTLDLPNKQKCVDVAFIVEPHQRTTCLKSPNATDILAMCLALCDAYMAKTTTAGNQIVFGILFGFFGLLFLGLYFKHRSMNNHSYHPTRVWGLSPNTLALAQNLEFKPEAEIKDCVTLAKKAMKKNNGWLKEINKLFGNNKSKGDDNKLVVQVRRI